MRNGPKRILVVVDVDPTRSERATEALRMSLGLAAASNEVRVVLRRGEPDHPRAAGFIEALDRLNARVETAEDVDFADADVVVRWTTGEESRRLLPGDGPGVDLDASPDADALLDRILADERVVIW